MHPRNPYINPPDFRSLADSFSSLEPFVSISPASGKYAIDFKNSQAQRTLTQVLLKKDFGLTLDIPENRLCPPVPNRLNYVLWIQDIVAQFSPVGAEPAPKIRGLDIGTGATAIYPLLGCSLYGNENWTFVATEIDPLSCDYATRNISKNNLTSRIEIYPVNRTKSVGSNAPQHQEILVPLLSDNTSRFDFTMCNPPFYGSIAEIEQSADAKEGPPSGTCTGAETEMITPGGESSFVLEMIHESIREDVKLRCRWFTSMLGKLSSVGEVVAELRKLKIDNYIITQFVQGETRRWAIGWSFGVDRLPDSIARASSQSLIPLLPLPTTLRQSIAIPSSEARTALSQVLMSMEDILYHFQEMSQSRDTAPWVVTVEAKENTWSRSARRKRKREASHIEEERPRKLEVTAIPELGSDRRETTDTALFGSPCSLVCRISPMPVSEMKNSCENVVLEAQWIKGDRRSMFEGFWSHVCRKLKDKEHHPITISSKCT